MWRAPSAVAFVLMHLFAAASPALALPTDWDEVRSCHERVEIDPLAGELHFLQSGVPFGYGDILMDAAQGTQPNTARYTFDAPVAGNYDLFIEYASGEPRPIMVTVNGKMLTGSALSGVTGGFDIGNQQLVGVANGVRLLQHENSLTLYRSTSFPHVHAIVFRATSCK